MFWIFVSTTLFAVQLGADTHYHGAAFAASTLAVVSPVVATPLGIQLGVRGSALVARVGGEEFIVLDVMEPGHTQEIAERVRCAIAAPADQAPVTASIGVTHAALDTFTARQADAATLLDTSIKTADHALLDAKRNGGNTATHLPPIDVSG
jgi:diguanylate cyclase (GGDEF)-like protein